MSDITLSAGVRQNLLSLQNVASELATTQNALATGKKVNSALDNANEYFTSQALNSRANSLSNLLDGITNGINTIQAANNGISAITKLVNSAQSLVTQAQQTSDTTVQASLATQYDSVLSQITSLAGDSGYNGINLLAGTGNALTLTLDETGQSSLTVQGQDTSATGLGLTASGGSWASLGTNTTTGLAAAATALTTSLSTLQSESAALSSQVSTIQIRSDFTSATINTLQTGASALVAADSNEEGANLLALQTQQSLSTTALSLSAQSDRNVLKLFGG
jgi:flagellin-like hook-associated protein FlgL